MAKTRINPATNNTRQKKKKKRRAHSAQAIPCGTDDSTLVRQKPETPEQMYLEASELLYQLELEKALPLAQKSLVRFQDVYSGNPRASYPALLLLAQIYLARGEPDLSRQHYLEATELDPEGHDTGAAPFLWCAQLSEQGGEDSIRWYEKASEILRRELESLEKKQGFEDAEDAVLKARRELGEALCSMTEVYMTDLSYDPEAGTKCDALITEAVLVCPESPAVLQTLASVRISEDRFDDAKSALTRSMELWKYLPADNVNIPDFATRISLVRLLLEVEMEIEAVEMVDQLVQEDDQSVEALYLAAWSRFLLSEKRADTTSESRDWFRRCLRVYTSLDYEDEKLRKHVVEMIAKLDDTLGPPTKQEENDDEAEWEDEEGQEEDGDIEVQEEECDVAMGDASQHTAVAQ